MAHTLSPSKYLAYQVFNKKGIHAFINSTIHSATIYWMPVTCCYGLNCVVLSPNVYVDALASV